MYDIGQIIVRNKVQNQRIVNTIPSDRGKRHYWQSEYGDYGLYQSQEKQRAKSIALQYSQRINKSILKSHRFATQPIEPLSLPKTRRQNYTSLQRSHHNDGCIVKTRRNVQQGHRQNNEEIEEYAKSPKIQKLVDNFDEVNKIVLPSIKKEKFEQQAQTTNSLMKFRPSFNSIAKSIEEPVTSQTPMLSNNRQKLDPNSLIYKKKLSGVPRVQKIGEDDVRYEKYVKPQKNQIKIKSYKSYLKYTPTYASSQNNQLSHYFGNGPLEYQHDEGLEQTIKKL